MIKFHRQSLISHFSWETNLKLEVLFLGGPVTMKIDKKLKMMMNSLPDLTSQGVFPSLLLSLEVMLG